MALPAAVKAAKLAFSSPEAKKKIKNVVIGILCISILGFGTCGIAFQQTISTEVAKWFKPTLTEKYYPNLSEKSEQLDTRFLYSTYIILFYEQDHETNEGRRHRVIVDLLSCFFNEVEETEVIEIEVEIENEDGKKEKQIKTETKTVKKYIVITDVEKVFLKIENTFRIKITEEQKDNIFKTKEFLETSGYFGSGSASELAEFALQFVGEGHSRFTTYSSHNGSGFGDNWCAMFVSYCTDNMGYIDEGIVHYFVGCTSNGIVKFRSEGRFEEGAGFGGTYQPQPGDIIFFNWDSVNSYADHVGIVTESEGSVIRTVEGNSGSNSWQSSKVCEKSYEYKSRYIVGYFPLSQYVQSNDATASSSNGSWAIRSSAPSPSDKAYKSPINNFPSMFDHGANAGNCTAYAYGRVYETQGIKLNINGNAGDWWYYNSSNSKHSQKPVAGAVLCWSGNGAGHVAFCEKVNSDGSIIITESGYYSFRWKKRTVTKAENYGWSNYNFQGFIIPKK